MISASLVKELRESTGAGMLDCKKALEATNGDMDAAVDWLREKGISKAAKKADRIAAEGLAEIKVADGIAAIVEVNSETDFVAKNEEFTSMVDMILTAIIANTPKTVEDVLALNCGEGTVNELIVNKIAKIGEKLSLRRFERIEKKDSESFGSYIHMGGKIAVLTVIDNASEEIAKDVAMHAAAMRPAYVKSAEVPTDVLNKEKEIMKEQLLNEGKPADRIEGILVGKVKKYYEEVCLENQIFIKQKTKKQLLNL
jgi:elongation factor Ts